MIKSLEYINIIILETMEKNEKIPILLQNSKINDYLSAQGLVRTHQGIKDIYRLPSGQLLILATDHVKTSGFILNALIPHRGEVITAMTHFWDMKIINCFCNHLIESRLEETEHANAAYDLKEIAYPGLPVERCLVVKDMASSLLNFKIAFTHQQAGTFLREPIFTPLAKNVGQQADFNSQIKAINKEDEARMAIRMLGKIYREAFAYAREAGLLIMETEFEIAFRPDGSMIVGEFLTINNSNFVLEKEWQKAAKRKRNPTPYVEEPLSEWSRNIITPFFDKKSKPIVGLYGLDPENSEHITFVHSLVIPSPVIKETEKRQKAIFKTLTGQSLGSYQREFMKK